MMVWVPLMSSGRPISRMAPGGAEVLPLIMENLTLRPVLPTTAARREREILAQSYRDLVLSTSVLLSTVHMYRTFFGAASRLRGGVGTARACG